MLCQGWMAMPTADRMLPYSCSLSRLEHWKALNDLSYCLWVTVDTKSQCLLACRLVEGWSGGAARM